MQIGGCRSARCLNAAATSCACALRHARTVVKVLRFCCIAQHRLLRALRHALTVTCPESTAILAVLWKKCAKRMHASIRKGYTKSAALCGRQALLKDTSTLLCCDTDAQDRSRQVGAPQG